MLIDKAAAAFLATTPVFTKERSLADHTRWVVKDAEGNRLTSGLGHTLEETDQIIRNLKVQAGIVAAMQEIISVKVLTVALINCGAPIGAANKLASNLLPAIIELASSEETDVMQTAGGNA